MNVVSLAKFFRLDRLQIKSFLGIVHPAVMSGVRYDDLRECVHVCLGLYGRQKKMCYWFFWFVIPTPQSMTNNQGLVWFRIIS